MKMDLRHGKVCYWALIFSVAAHSVTLAVFTGVKLSGRTEAEVTPKPVISLQMIERIVAEPTPKPKPRIESIVESRFASLRVFQSTPAYRRCLRGRHRLPDISCCLSSILWPLEQLLIKKRMRMTLFYYIESTFANWNIWIYKKQKP